MPRIYRQNCAQCGKYYEGYGLQYCSTECAGIGQRRDPNTDHHAHDKPSEDVVVDLAGDTGIIYVEASQQIKTPEELWAKAELDPEVWEWHAGKVSAWGTPMKIKDEAHVIQLHYVSIQVRKRADTQFEFRPISINVNTKILKARSEPGDASLHYSDIHVPYHDPRAFDIALQIADITNPHIVVDHGDTLDCENLSKYPKKPGSRKTLHDERVVASEMIGQMHSITPNARHIWLEGNHEERIKRVVWAAAEANSGLSDILTLPEVERALEWGSLLGLDSLGWEVVRYPKHVLLYDRFICAHGSVVRKDSALSARAQYEKYNKSGASGHTHRVGAYHHTNYKSPRCWLEIGMLGQVRADYVDHANWQQGLLVLSWSKDRERFGVEQVSIIEGVAYFRGMRLEGKA